MPASRSLSAPTLADAADVASSRPSACDAAHEGAVASGAQQPGAEPRLARGRLVGAWLVVAAAMAFALIVLGGVVRLTRAGLSITEWAPVSGTLPPMGEAAWGVAFAKYRATPEYAAVNTGMSMGEFRVIFLLEYAHRLLGRVTGLVLALPLLYALARRRLSLREARPIFYVLLAGLAQALLGWLMVRSGLIDVPHVSPQRLAAHLVVGVGLFAALVWMLVARRAASRSSASPWSLLARRLGVATLGLATLTVAWGGLMAGTHAGLFFPTFPTMAGSWAPFELAADARAIASDPVMIHFLHRALALALALSSTVLVAATWRRSRRMRVLGGLTLAALVAQLTLGALVVLYQVPLALASLHQANGVLLVGLLTALVAELIQATAAGRGARVASRPGAA